MECDKTVGLIDVRVGAVRNILDSMGIFRPILQSILERTGIDTNKPDIWITQSRLLEALCAVYERLGPSVLSRMGFIAESQMYRPDGIHSIDDAVLKMDIFYHLNHRKNGKLMFDEANGMITDGIGHVKALMQNDREVVITDTSPYPCETMQAIIDQYLGRSCGGHEVHVKHVRGEPCKRTGGASCTYTVYLFGQCL